MEGAGLIYELVQQIKAFIEQLVAFFRDWNDNH